MKPSRDQSEGSRSLPSSVTRCCSTEPLTSLRNNPLLENTTVLPSGDQIGLSEIPDDEVKRLTILRSASSIQIFARPGPSRRAKATSLPSGEKRKSYPFSLRVASGFPPRSRKISSGGFEALMF